MSRTPEHMTWKRIIGRCNNPNNSKYPIYGGRGIKVCDRWRNSFQCFFDDMGKRPESKTSIERRDNNGNYCPENCYWGDNFDQANNKSNNIFIEYCGKKMTASQWGRHIGMNDRKIRQRMSRGWSVERTLTTK
ncbi:MAG: hypothetical protein DRH90_25575 [Deltaproteobacteria bacterium]|nr:MAG: hypothetical protein DRH90_25575 [Deltaproteobacteria bacterium]